MRFTSLLAIYFLFWFLSLFVVLPFGVKTSDELGQPKVPGQADSAPHEFRPWRIILRTTIVSAILFALFYANFTYGWLTIQDVYDMVGAPPRE